MISCIILIYYNDQPAYWCKLKNPFFAKCWVNFLLFLPLFSFFAQKTLKRHILTAFWSAQYPNGGQKIQHITLTLFRQTKSFQVRLTMKLVNTHQQKYEIWKVHILKHYSRYSEDHNNRHPKTGNIPKQNFYQFVFLS